MDKIKELMKKIADKLRPIADKLRPIPEKIRPAMKKLLPLVVKYKKYIASCGVFVLMACIMYFFTGEEYVAERIAKLNSKEVSGDDYVPDKEFSINEHEAVNELITTYFGAYVEADFETLESIATPLSEMEKSYIGTMCQFYESYENINCYTKYGLSKDSYIVAACFDIKFLDEEELAPSMVLFYVETDDNGELYINNLYSEFNLQYREHAISKEVWKAIVKYTNQDDYLELTDSVQTAFNDLLKANEGIYVLTMRTIPIMRQDWEDEVYYSHETEEPGMDEPATEEPGTDEPGTDAPVTEEPGTEPPATQTPGTEPPATQTPTTPTEPEEPEELKVRVTSDNVNVRSEAKKSSSSLGKVDSGTVLVKLGVEGDWTKVMYDNQIGYIKSNLVEEVTE